MNSRLTQFLTRLPPVAPALESTGDFSVSSGSSRAQFESMGVRRRGIALLGSHVAESGFVIAGWSCIGAGALSGRLDQGWIMAWVLCLVSVLPLRGASQWLTGVVTTAAGGWLRERLLIGATTIDAQVIQRKGTGELLCEVLELEQIERLATSGGLAAALALLELLAVFIVFTWLGSAEYGAVLLAWIAIAFLLLWRNTRRRFRWTRLRFDITYRLVESMSAHRTRAVQQPLAERHVQEDRDHEQYAELSRQLDRSTTLINTLLSRGYGISALLVFTPSLLDGNVAISYQAAALGGILIAAAAFRRLGPGLVSAATAWVSLRYMRTLLDAAGAASDVADSPVAMSPSAANTLTATEVLYTHPGRAEPTLKECSLVLKRGDAVVLEGASGSGKSTLAAGLAGLCTPQAGLVMAGGLDRQTAGRAWRRYVALAPQCHENHILSAPLAFNLLLGRPLPHSQQDIADAIAICEELGLGPVVARMPAGIEQMVGETGWQLSHGERSRVYLARALLQGAQVIILDESFAALDPENILRCIECVLRRAPTTLVIAHP